MTKSKKKITINKKAKHWRDKYPMVSVDWLDIVSNASWCSFEELQKSKLATCTSKGHLYSQSKGITRLFADCSTKDNGEIEEIGNTTIIPNSVIVKVTKL
tara:strand:+ start:1466 stop:1765 length:300 start_codon:yes stop_codon:yes gene_type:complete